MATEVLTATVGNSSKMEGNCDIPVKDSGTGGGKDPSETNWPKPSPGQPVSAGNNQQKKAHRRKPSKKKRKWKPYSKMSWEERKALDEKEKFKAVRIREEMKEKGRPVAPYNTTQFLMEEHDPYDGVLESTGYNNSNLATTGTDEGESYSDDQDEMNGTLISAKDEEDTMAEYTDSPHMVPEFISQDFSETYERVHEESLNTMSREELLSEHMDLDTRFNHLQEQMGKTKRSHASIVNALEAQIEELKCEKDGMKAKIERLNIENEMLRSGKSEYRMLTSDNEDSETRTRQMSTLVDGEVIERR